MRADSQILFGAAKQREEVLVQWKQPPENFISINTDGSVLQPHSHASAVGILRDEQGRKLAVFAANLGTCSIMRAELRAADIGLKIAWKMGFRKIHLQMDSLAAVKAICGRVEEDSRHYQTISSIQERLSKEWEVQIFHVYREANKVADMLADHGHSLSFGYVVNCVYSPEIDREIWNDFIGASTPRLVLENE
ncbi:Putative ribonuclease H protein At1g65750 [Linum perenne]